MALWVWIGLGAIVIIGLLGWLSAWKFRKNSKRSQKKKPLSINSNVGENTKVDSIGFQNLANQPESVVVRLNDKAGDTNLEMIGISKSTDADSVSQCSSMYNQDKALSSHSGEEGSSGSVRKHPARGIGIASPLIGLPGLPHHGWGHWFTLRDLQKATNNFSADNVIGEGGYGTVYHGVLANCAEVAVKKLFNNQGQAEKEFRVEVEAIGHVRHKHLVRLLGYCVEGVNRLLVYEYMNNGNLEQWLHGAMRQHGIITWEARMKVILGTAKALAYLHEAIEPKVIHRDIKSSNILIDHEFNSKVSDFGLAKLLDAGATHVTTRVMGTFGYVAPEYANSGMLNEKSDVYSFGVVLLESVSGRDPVDDGRGRSEANLVDWLKMMVAEGRYEEAVDPDLETKPPKRALKRAILVALKCVDPDSEKRPKMSQVVRLLEDDEFPYREDRRNRRTRTASMENEAAMRESCGSVELEAKVEQPDSQRADTLHE